MRILASLALASLAFPQSGKPPAVAKQPDKQTASQCAVIASGNNNQISNLTCFGIDTDLAKQIKDLAEATNKDTSLLRLVHEQLAKLLENSPARTQIFIQPGVVITGGQNNLTFNAVIPPVHVSFDQVARASRIEETMPRPGMAPHVLPPSVELRINVDSPLELPAFLAWCDRPCVSGEAWYGNLGSKEKNGPQANMHGTTNNAVAGMVMSNPRPFGPGVTIYWEIFSLDKESPKILNVEPLGSQVAAKFLENAEF